MNSGQTVFAQLIEFLPKHVFRKCVLRYKGDYRLQVKVFSCRDQFLCMAFAQITYRESLRDIESCIACIQFRNSSGLESAAKFLRSTLADANELRDHRIYEDFAMHLVTIAQGLYSAESWGRNLKRSVFALDATTIDLCLSLFPWAKFLQTKRGGVKVHALIDVVTRIPTVIRVTPGNIHEVRILDELCFGTGCDLPDGSWVCRFSNGCIDCILNGAFFVIRAVKKARVQTQRVAARGQAKRFSVRSNCSLGEAPFLRQPIPKGLRRISFPRSGKTKTPGLPHRQFSVGCGYGRSTLQISLAGPNSFSNGSRQNLRIKSFYGTTENAVKSSNLDRGRDLFACRDHEKNDEPFNVVGHDSPSFKRHTVRENTFAGATLRDRHVKCGKRFL